MRIATSAAHTYAAPPTTLFDLATDPAVLPRIFKGYGPIPAITSARLEGGTNAPGALLLAEGADGAPIRHPIQAVERPSLYRYALVGPFRSPLSLLVREATSTWRFEPAGAGTRITWSYVFELTSPLAYAPATLLVRVLMRKAMERCLEELAGVAASA